MKLFHTIRTFTGSLRGGRVDDLHALVVARDPLHHRPAVPGQDDARLGDEPVALRIELARQQGAGGEEGGACRCGGASVWHRVLSG
jgi:hypothetical protein